MRRWLPAVVLGLAWVHAAPAHGLLLPTNPETPPLAMVAHEVRIEVEDQAAVTQVTQTFRNHTDRALEADYVFPVPRGAGVNKFTMWVDGKEVGGELVEADKARAVYTEIVRRTRDPGLLEYVGADLLRVRVFPVPAHGDQKLSVRYTSVANAESGLIEYVYPLKADGKAAPPLEKFTLEAVLKSQHSLHNVYSPSHAVTVSHPSDHEARVVFAAEREVLDKDFVLYYALGDKDVGLTALTHRPDAGADGSFLLLVSPRAELAKAQEVPRDMVFVLDTSGSMAGAKMEQARKALKVCLNNLSDKDRFAVMNFATTVTKFHDELLEGNDENRARARKWVDALEAVGGTAIDDALAAALDLRGKNDGRSFTVVFFTDGEPTVGEVSPEKILKNVAARNTADTRIFTFGVGDDVNAALLDRLADQTRAVSTYVRPAEDIEAKVSGLYSKISHPVLTNLKLTAGPNVTLSEVYPHQLPDLFHGGQLVVLGRYSGHGHAALTLSGTVGKETREFVYEASFPDKTGDDKAFVEDLWARRKVGFLLDQIRVNGEKKELTEEVVKLAKKHNIPTPYTSLLVVPDQRAPVANQGGQGRETFLFRSAADTDDAGPASVGSRVVPQTAAGGYSSAGHGYRMAPAPAAAAAPRINYAPVMAQTGKEGVDFALQLHALRSEEQAGRSSERRVGGRTCREVAGVWVDEGYAAGKVKVVTVKAQSAAYFRILERRPAMKDVFQLGNRVIWMTPSGAALVVDAEQGQEQLSDEEIDKLFVEKK